MAGAEGRVHCQLRCCNGFTHALCSTPWGLWRVGQTMGETIGKQLLQSHNFLGHMTHLVYNVIDIHLYIYMYIQTIDCNLQCIMSVSTILITHLLLACVHAAAASVTACCYSCAWRESEDSRLETAGVREGIQ